MTSLLGISYFQVELLSKCVQLKMEYTSNSIVYSQSSNALLSVCLSVCLGLWDLRCAPPREYRSTLCTIDLRCAPPTCVVYHGAQGEPMSIRSGGHPRHFSFFGGSQGTCKIWTLFVRIWWGTRARTHSIYSHSLVHKVHRSTHK